MQLKRTHYQSPKIPTEPPKGSLTLEPPYWPFVRFQPKHNWEFFRSALRIKVFSLYVHCALKKFSALFSAPNTKKYINSAKSDCLLCPGIQLFCSTWGPPSLSWTMRWTVHRILPYFLVPTVLQERLVLRGSARMALSCCSGKPSRPSGFVTFALVSLGGGYRRLFPLLFPTSDSRWRRAGLVASSLVRYIWRVSFKYALLVALDLIWGGFASWWLLHGTKWRVIIERWLACCFDGETMRR